MRWGGGGRGALKVRRAVWMGPPAFCYAPATVRRIWEMTCMLEQGSIGVSKAAGGAGMLKYNVEGGRFPSRLLLEPQGSN